MRGPALPERAEEGSEGPIGDEEEEETRTLPSLAKLYLGAVYASAIGVGALAVFAASGRAGGEELAASTNR